MERRHRLLFASPWLLLSACALLGPRPGPPPDAPTESALSAAPAPAVCKVSPSLLRRVGPIEAGVTTIGEAVERLGRPPVAGESDRLCWKVAGSPGAVLFVSGRLADQPIRGITLADPEEDAERACGVTTAVPAPLALEAGLRPGMARAEVEQLLGALAPDERGSFGKECCGLEQTGEGEGGPVYGFGCSAILGVLREGRLASVAVSRYAPPSTQEGGR